MSATPTATRTGTATPTGTPTDTPTATFTATATDADSPAQLLTFSLTGAPTGATIDGSTGVFSWTPSEDQGPGTYPFSVNVSDGVATTTSPISVTVTEVNAALRERGMFGGHDLSRDFPELGQAALYCVTEIHTREDIDRLACALQEVLGMLRVRGLSGVLRRIKDEVARAAAAASVANGRGGPD